MLAKKEEVTLRPTLHQAYRVRRLERKLWTEKDLGIGEISRRLLLEHLLWPERAEVSGGGSRLGGVIACLYSFTFSHFT